MKETSRNTDGSMARGALLVGLAAAVGAVVYALREPDDPREIAPATQTADIAAAPPDPQAAAAEPDAAADTAADSAADTPEDAAGDAPGFDVVRVAPDGAALVAGHAAPGARVTIRADGETIAETEADASGDFVAMFDAEASAEPQALTLEAETPEGRTLASDDVVVLLPQAEGRTQTAEIGTAGPEAAPTGIAEAGPGTGAPAAPEAAPERTATDRTVAEAVAEAEAAQPAEAAPGAKVAVAAVLGAGGVEAMPTGATDGLTLASISYGETGLITLAGLGDAGAALRVYVDDRFARAAEVDPTGRWATELGDVEAGVYRLRIDALGPDGRVASRIETPFQRDFPKPGARPGTITVQPGNNLWTIARIHYGSGVLYTQIHTANRDLIRDPELIYPGQIFVLPEPAQTE